MIIIVYNPKLFTIPVYVIHQITIRIVLPTSPLHTKVGVVSLVIYGALLSHPILVIVGATGAVVSDGVNTTGITPVHTFPA